MTATYTPLANVTLGSTASSITFGSIPATYRDLICVVVAGGSTTITPRMRFNSDSGTNYHHMRMSATGDALSAISRTIDTTQALLSSIARARTTDQLQVNASIMDYSATDKHKTILSRADNAAMGTDVVVSRWGDTSAITSVEISASTGTWSIGSTFALYGVIA
jgi:hypothetical protein